MSPWQHLVKEMQKKQRLQCLGIHSPTPTHTLWFIDSHSQGTGNTNVDGVAFHISVNRCYPRDASQHQSRAPFDLESCFQGTKIQNYMQPEYWSGCPLCVRCQMMTIKIMECTVLCSLWGLGASRNMPKLYLTSHGQWGRYRVQMWNCNHWPTMAPIYQVCRQQHTEWMWNDLCFMFTYHKGVHCYQYWQHLLDLIRWGRLW